MMDVQQTTTAQLYELAATFTTKVKSDIQKILTQLTPTTNSSPFTLIEK